MEKKEENRGFKCIHCQKGILPVSNGSYRNHCPFCFVSLHVDNVPGDRKNPCRGIMYPKKIILNSKKGWQLIHQCQTCGKTSANRIAEGSVQPGDWNGLIQLGQGKWE